MHREEGVKELFKGSKVSMSLRNRVEEWSRLGISTPRGFGDVRRRHGLGRMEEDGKKGKKSKPKALHLSL